MSSSDTFSETSTPSPRSYTDSSRSSPCQEESCYTVPAGNDTMHIDGPMLRIIEQPQDHFRFRYKSEMAGTHGCILGRKYIGFKAKTYPTVQLIGYNGRATVSCTLAQCNNTNDHPHLLEDDESSDVTREACHENDFTAKFQGMGIIHIAKKQVASLLFEKYMKYYNHKAVKTKDLRAKCEKEARDIDLNIVRLKFTAHDEVTNRLICPPVYSEPIHNMKSAATNEIKICRISKVFGRAKGGDEIYIFVEKVNKNNIEIRFVEKSPSGEVLWMAKGLFTKNDVHHQYGIAFRTPQYKDPSTASDVKVHIELLRPSDGRTSNPIEFTYKADYVQKNKKRKNYSYSSIGSSTGGSVKSFSELPVSVVPPSKHIDYNETNNDERQKIFFGNMPKAPICEPLAEALYNNAVDPALISPMVSQPNVPTPPIPIQIDSADIDKMLDLDVKLESAEIRDFLNQYTDSFKSNDFDEIIMPQQDPDGLSIPLFKSSMDLIADSPRNKEKTIVKSEKSEDTPVDKSYEFYSSEESLEVKKLLREMCEIIDNKDSIKITGIKCKLRRLFNIRPKNGDMFLIIALEPNLVPIFNFVVKLLHELNMTDLLNLRNKDSETVLHYIIKNDLLEHLDILLSKGCDPMLEDKDGNNAIHYCITYQNGLRELLTTIKKYKINYDINAYNNDKQTPLQTAVLNDSAISCQLLIEHGADFHVKDALGRTPLHLAAFNGQLEVLSTLLQYIDNTDVDNTDSLGYTPLQIVCDVQQQANSYDIAKLLLQKGANPLMRDLNNESPYKLICNKSRRYPSLSQLKDLLVKYLPNDDQHNIKVEPDDIKLEVEDVEYESAEEWENEKNLRGMLLYIDELSELLDRSGRWRQLARRLQCDTLLNWFENTPSPTRTLFSQIKEMNEGYTSRSLAMTLNDMGDTDAANIILRYIDG